MSQDLQIALAHHQYLHGTSWDCLTTFTLHLNVLLSTALYKLFAIQLQGKEDINFLKHLCSYHKNQYLYAFPRIFLSSERNIDDTRKRNIPCQYRKLFCVIFINLWIFILWHLNDVKCKHSNQPFTLLLWKRERSDIPVERKRSSWSSFYCSHEFVSIFMASVLSVLSKFKRIIL